ncbi:hypothetical protein BU17DRAFT_61065 [Hysterangium stoloniferum]|nr:hypothetical protein BU17DRAFT_61065 [Hysterangium stoloniferum]
MNFAGVKMVTIKESKTKCLLGYPGVTSRSPQRLGIWSSDLGTMYQEHQILQKSHRKRFSIYCFHERMKIDVFDHSVEEFAGFPFSDLNPRMQYDIRRDGSLTGSFQSLLMPYKRTYCWAFVNNYLKIIVVPYQNIAHSYSLLRIVLYIHGGLRGVATLPLAVDTLILSRIYALYNGNRKSKVIIVLLSKGFGTTAVLPNPLLGVLSGCFPATPFNTKTILYAGGIPIAFQGKILTFYAYKEGLTAFEAVYLGLSLYILFRRAQAFRLLTRRTPMLKIFFREELIVAQGRHHVLFDFIGGPLRVLSHDDRLVMYVVNILTVTYGGKSPLQRLGETWLAPVVSISAGRLVLNLRGSVTSSDTNDNDEEPTEMDAWTGRDEQVGQFSSVIMIGSMGMNNHNVSSSTL